MSTTALLHDPATSVAQPVSVERRLLNQLMSQSDETDLAALMAHSAVHLGLLSGWRWAAVTRYVDEGRSAQLLAFADRGHLLPGYTYALSHAPCRLVEAAGGITHLDRVLERFAEDRELADLGVMQYVGLVYRRAGTVLGHVFLMHDEALSPQQAHGVDSLLQLATLHIGSRLEVAGLLDTVSDLQALAETDSLTGLPNRRAFERELSLQLALCKTGSRKDCLLAILDVNGLKRVNDDCGHLEGDRLLQTVAQIVRQDLRRGQDKLFRIGGDEFALLVDAPKPGCDGSLLPRAALWQAGIHAAGYAGNGLSCGAARLSESHGDRNTWLALADGRMYADKGNRRRA